MIKDLSILIWKRKLGILFLYSLYSFGVDLKIGVVVLKNYYFSDVYFIYANDNRQGKENSVSPFMFLTKEHF